jgi:hypothetical protein
MAVSSLTHIHSESELDPMSKSRVVAPADDHHDEATRAVQTALDRRDNGGKAGK